MEFSRIRQVEESNLMLYDSKTTYRYICQILSITSDSRLNCVLHLKSLTANVSTFWDQWLCIVEPIMYRSCIFWFYKAYAMFGYATLVVRDKQTAWWMLDPMHNSSIRLAIGACSCSSFVSLVAESLQLTQFVLL